MKIEDIAKLAGVSISTVSRVTNNYSNVPAETREKIMAIINEHGYVANSSARILAGKLNKTIGLFIVEIHEKYEKNMILPSAWFTNIISAVVNYASDFDYNVLVTIIAEKDDTKKIKEMFVNKTICSGIFVGAENEVPEIEELDKLGFKVAILEQKRPEGVERVNSIFVSSDNIKGGYEATKYLIMNGHTKILHISGNNLKSPTQDRLLGYKKALKEFGIKEDKKYIIKGDFLQDLAYKNTKKAIENGIEFTGIFAASDDMALGAMKAVKDCGMKIPEDISIIGYDDSIISSLSNITSVKAHGEEMAEIMVKNLINGIESNTRISSSYVVDTELSIRGSVKNIK